MRKPLPCPGTTGAFTLVELVISASLMSLILVSAYVCLNGSLATQRLIESRSDVIRSGRVVLGMISADLRSACVLSPKYPFSGMDRTLGQVEADNLDFATRHYTPAKPGEGDFCEVSYFLEADPGVENAYVLWRRRDPHLDADPFAGGNREELARGVRKLKFEYYDGWSWFDTWGDSDTTARDTESAQSQSYQSGLPEAVRVTLWLEPDHPGGQRRNDEEKRETPLVFETTCRLNLASLSQGSSSAGEGGEMGASGEKSRGGTQ